MSTPTRDLHDNISPITLIAPATLNADNTPTSVDLRGFMSAAVMLYVGPGGITFSGTNKIEFVLQHSDDNSAWSNVASADVVGAPAGPVISGGIVRALVAAKAAEDITKLSYVGGKRYIRLTADFSGTHGTGTLITAFVIRGNPEQAPVA